MAATEPFTVMAKPVGPRCNMACGYCYYLETQDMYGTALPPRMSLDLLETYIRKYIEASLGPIVSFTWHGGEPTLAGLDFYKKAVELQKRYLPSGWEAWNNLQTNGLLLDDKWCNFLQETRFDVGLSVDGTQEAHDSYRVDLSGRGTYNRVVAACRRLQRHGIQPDILCTVNHTTAKDPTGVYKALSDLSTGWIQFIPIVERDVSGQVTPFSVTPQGYGDFLCATFDMWLRNDMGKLEIQQVAEMALVWSGGVSSLCWMAPVCGRVLIVEHDGAVYSCDHFVDVEHRIGHIATSSIPELVDSPTQRRFGLIKRDGLPQECKVCPWLSVCYGGCPKYRGLQVRPGVAPDLSYLCEGLKRFFGYAEKPLKRVIKERQKGTSPEAIMAQERVIWKENWRGIGRNDPCPCGSGRKAKNCCWERRP